MIHTTSTRNGTGTGTGTGTVPSSSTPVSTHGSTGSDLLPHGSIVTITAGTVAADGSPLTELELMGTIAGSRNHPHSGTALYLVSTSAGTDVEVDAHRVHPAPVPASWALELNIDGEWTPVPAGPGWARSGKTSIVPTRDALYAFVLIAAGRARVPGRWVRASIAVASGLHMFHVEQPAGAKDAYGLAVTLAGGRVLLLSFGTLRAREAAVRVLVTLDQVAGVETYGDCV